MNESDTARQKLIASAKAVHRGNFIVANAYIRDFESIT